MTSCTNNGKAVTVHIDRVSIRNNINILFFLKPYSWAFHWDEIIKNIMHTQLFQQFVHYMIEYDK